MATTRVYILAKELGVKSAAIVEKCQAEDLDVKNHMSTISAGLAATIREWFSEGEHTTTVETAQKVDLKKVRIKKKVKRKLPAKETKAKAKDKKSKTEPQTDESAPDSAPTALVEPEEPAIPEPIIPAGPIMEKPEPAKLSGPQLVRIEAPEPHVRPKPKRQPKKPGRPKYDLPITEPLMPGKLEPEKSVSASTKEKKKPPKRHKDRTHGRRQEQPGSEGTKRARFTTQRRQRDIEERRARLDAAGGEGLRLRPKRKIASMSDRGF